ncbi:sushi, von Willebrand factor type A, EGF and pentraxin domain-containing protein 1-like isoform X2 [Silurus meridionalis]|uniref:Sushi domain-containing protein n=1 Tax=Silurus meridionalis TaxID=175797 RepID=A0A8T0AWS8_SILME|nr:sushi, von Willebrand factor type A, EGF and pentraxin domain-containing protein 1-like isoform X2 [Silurus meridionalis]KAF7696155.1 hypothetical protein HF521_006249 [Silurus meridionalis]
MFRFMIIFYALLLTAANVRAQCVRPVVGQNRVLSEDNDEQTFPDQSIVRFKCSTGYVTARASASRSITCTGTQWSNLELRCKKKSCGHPGEINNGRYTFPREEGILFGATIVAECNEGYKLVGQAFRNCRETGWDGRSPVCEVLKCLPPSRIQSGTFAPEEESYDYGDVVTYSCKRGLDLIGSSEISCSGDGTFKPDPPRCLDVSCDSLNIRNAFRIEGKSPPYKYNNFVRYKCNRGFKMEGSDFLTCTENGWNPSAPKCNVITCLEPPTITKGDFSPQKELYAYGERVTYYCVEGFKLYGSPTISCSDDETFGTSFPECREIFCDPPYIRNAVIDETSRSPAYRYGTSIKISCNKGYRMEGSEYLTCVDGWTALPRCVEMTCDAPRINNAVIVSRRYTVFTERYRYGAFIQLRCNSGYRMEGSDRLKCEEYGWNPPPPKCSVITCLEPPTITNGQFIPPKVLYKYGETVTYNCVEGFKLYGSPTISCSDNGMFETSLPECREIFCDPPSIQNAVIDETSRAWAYRYQTSIKIRCNKGYRLEGSEYMTCGNDGWTPALPRCVKLSCDAPKIDYAVIQEIDSDATSIRVKCKTGYRINGSDYLTCEENGWNSSLPKCNIVNCSKPTEMNNGKPLKDIYTYKENITYSCEKGLKIYGASTITCHEDGTFQPPPLPCLEVTCDAPNINNAVIVNGQAPYRAEMSIQYQCNKGYNMEGSGNLTCEENGWNPDPPQCKIVTCPKPLEIINGEFNPVKEEYEYGQTIIHFCKKGFRLEGDSAVSCTDDGTFHFPASLKCVVVTCPKPLEIINGEFNPVKEEYEYGQTIIHFCKKGFRLEGDSAVSCTDDGTFHFPASLKCVEVTCDEPQFDHAFIIEGKSPPYKYKSSIRVKCENGYTMDEEFEFLTCEENGWEPSPPQCRPKNGSGVIMSSSASTTEEHLE